MELYPIITVPAPVLREKAQPVSRVDDSVRAQLDRMLETMYEAPGIGLAANQVGLLNRVFVMDITRREPESEKEPFFMVNPHILWRSDEPSVIEEGCLSIPGQYAEIQRPAKVRVRWTGYDGQEEEGEFEGLASHCVQHEIDHLDGVLFVDYISKLRRDMMIRRVKKMTKGGDIL